MHQQINKEIIINEILKCDNFIYIFKIGNLKLEVSSKKLYKSLVNKCYYFKGMVGSEFRFDYYTHVLKRFYVSEKYFFSEIRKITGIRFSEVRLLIQKVLKEDFNLNIDDLKIIPLLINFF